MTKVTKTIPKTKTIKKGYDIDRHVCAYVPVFFFCI